LWIPFLCTVFIAITNSYQEEQLFHFKKANGLWNGGFSLSYFFGPGRIFIAGFVILINYIGFKKYFKNNRKKSGYDKTILSLAELRILKAAWFRLARFYLRKSFS